MGTFEDVITLTNAAASSAVQNEYSMLQLGRNYFDKFNHTHFLHVGSAATKLQFI
jgi:hypothetical protein